MKALEILYALKASNRIKYAGIDLDEAIAELETLESRSCEGCKYGKFGVDSLGYEIECRVLWTCARGHKDKWEAKQ